MLDESNIILKCVTLAYRYHGNQQYGDKNYVLQHLVPTATIVSERDTRRDKLKRLELKIATLFHDSVEDDKTDLVELTHDLETIREECGHPIDVNRIVATVSWLTRSKNENYLKYIKRLTVAPQSIRRDCIEIKKGDLWCHVANHCGESLGKRYEEALTMLEEAEEKASMKITWTASH